MEDKTSFLTIAKTVLMTAGVIYLVSLAIWFAHWATIIAAIAGVGYLVWRMSGLTSKTDKSARQLGHESSYEHELARLEAEERRIDSQIGI